MSDTYLQDFGHLRKQMRDREVHDPMSSAHRWEELELDMVKPHIPAPRRDAVSANRKLTIDGLEIKLKPTVKPETLAKLGFTASATGYKHALVTMKSDNYRRAMAEARRPEVKVKLAQFKLRFGSFKEAIHHYIKRIRFPRTADSVSDVYRRKIAQLWPYRNI